MLEAESGAVEVVSLLDPANAADTGAASGAWVDARKYEGNLVITQHVGVVTGGTIAGRMQHASDGAGTGAANITNGTFVTVTTATDPAIEKLIIPAGSVLGWVKYIGTIVTGPAAVGVTMTARPKYV